MANGDLAIRKANESHEGKYLCQASNGVGAGKSKIISVDVQGKWKWSDWIDFMLEQRQNKNEINFEIAAFFHCPYRRVKKRGQIQT